MSGNTEEELLLLFALCEDEEKNEVKKRKWTYDINLSREIKGEFYTLFADLQKDEKWFYQYFRMAETSFNEILGYIEQDIRKNDTNFRCAIPAIERLAITLRFLATGDNFKTIGSSYRVGFTTTGRIVKEVCQAIWNRMESTYLPEPTRHTWEAAANGFLEKWKFPNCVGSIDGKHVTIKCPQRSGSMYFSYLKKFSIVLLAVVGPDYKFICIDIGGYEKNSDSGIFDNSVMGRKFENAQFALPAGKPLLNQTTTTQYVLIGDEGFPLKTYLMRPFPYRVSRYDPEKETFNTCLSTARRVVENAFGILSQKWRIFFRPLETNVETKIKIVQAACVLHNFLRSTISEDNYLTVLEPPEPEMKAFLNLEQDAKRCRNEVFQIRQNLVNYFNAEKE